ncbi:MAG: YgiW/YdeI family stress tolerance OB fold protein [Vibrio sp.]
MKKLLTIATLMMASTAAFANTTPATGGFDGPIATDNKVTVKEALELKDDARVDLEGYVIESLGDEEYTFKDETGQIVIEIDHDKWNGVTATPETKVILQGEIDKDMMQDAKVDVDTVALVK